MICDYGLGNAHTQLNNFNIFNHIRSFVLLKILLNNVKTNSKVYTLIKRNKNVRQNGVEYILEKVHLP